MRIPGALKKQSLPLIDAMRQMRVGSACDDAEEVVDSLPNPLCRAQAFLCTLDNEWHYEFGTPYTVGTTVVVGTDQSPPVRILLDGLLRLKRLASGDDYERYLENLNHKPKHLEHLAELDPVLLARDLRALQYEPRPLGQEAPGPDWEMEFLDSATCLVEVKCRIKGLLVLLGSLLSGRRPSPDPERMQVPKGLLDDVSAKFPVRDAAKRTLQGVWVFSPVWYIQGELEAAFRDLDPNRVRFLVVGRSWREYEVYTRREEDRPQLALRFPRLGP